MKILIIVAIVLPIVLLALLIGLPGPPPPAPKRRLLTAFFMGVLAAVLAQLFVQPFPPIDVISLSDAAIEAFCQDAVPQECSKLLALFLLANNYSYFNKPFNGVIYAVCIGLGFTVIQNLFIFISAFNRWTEADTIQAILAVPGNYIFAIFMGVFMSLAWIDKKLRLRNAILTLAIPVLIHGLYNLMEFCTNTAIVFGIVIYTFFIFNFRKPRLWAEKMIDKKS